MEPLKTSAISDKSRNNFFWYGLYTLAYMENL
jgi:hypothetical protein